MILLFLHVGRELPHTQNIDTTLQLRLKLRLLKTMAATKSKTPKRRMMTSYENLSEELLELLKERYPNGLTDHMTRVDKPDGTFFHGVMLETEDTSYFVKISVKVDNKTQEDIEKDLFEVESREEEAKLNEDIADSDPADE